jgi:5-carboxymethyl-2-hydroxymuconic-semialdehyde dehydrogenase
MQINHLINGKSVPGTDYFETVNPATQEVLAEVASGGEAEVNAAVAAAKAAFPKWAATPVRSVPSLVRKLGDLIAASMCRHRRPRPTTAARSSPKPDKQC